MAQTPQAVERNRSAVLYGYLIGLRAIRLARLSERLKSAIGVPMALPLSARGSETALPGRYVGPMNHSVEG